jgi:hypothetical protein
MGLEIFELFPDKYDLFLFIRKHDDDTDGKLKFSEFIQAVTKIFLSKNLAHPKKIRAC